MTAAVQDPQSDRWAALEAGLALKTSPPSSSIKRRSGAIRKQPPVVAGGWMSPQGDGSRTRALVSMAGRLIASGLTPEEVTQTCLGWNRNNTPPLEESKVIDTCASLAQTDSRNHPARASMLAALLEDSGPPTPLFAIVDASIGSFLTTPPQRQRWVLGDFLPLGITATLVSPGGVGKSQLLMQLCYSVTTGIPLCGHWRVDEEGSVLMLCAEDSVEEIHRRVHRIHMQIGTGMSTEHTAKLNSRMFVRSVTGEDMLMTRLAGTGRELVRTSIAARLALTVKQLEDIKLIILDPASRFRGGDENSNDHGTRFVEVLEYLRTLTGATVLVAHHAGKGASRGGPTQDNSRGASSLTDGVRWQMVLTSVTGKHPAFKDAQATRPGYYVEAALVKTNYTAPKPNVYLRREMDGYLLAVTLNPAPPAVNQAMVQLLQAIATSAQPLTAKEVETRYCGRGKQIAIGQRASRELMKQAREDGLTQGYGKAPLTLTKAGKMFLESATRNSAAAAATPAVGGGKRQSGKPQ
ncbi:MAG: AAA family ATPase [Betaproteobacteria bacterium]|nr:AAA family ATPase [Betaproteobacteria bacterium]